jgi:outer membrane protein TolC
VQRYRAALAEHGATSERFEAAEAELEAADARRDEIERELHELVGGPPEEGGA